MSTEHDEKNRALVAIDETNAAMRNALARWRASYLTNNQRTARREVYTSARRAHAAAISRAALMVCFK